jgi:hypothetical protein
VLLDGDDVADTSHNIFDEVDYIHDDGIGLRLKSSGGNQLRMVFGYRMPGGTGVGTRLDSGNSIADDPVTNHFGWVQTGAGGFTVQGTASGSLPPKYNSIDAYSLGNGSPATPTIALGGQLSYNTEYGVQSNSRTGSFAIYDLNRATSTNASVIGKVQYSAYDSDSVAQTYAFFDGRIDDSAAGSEDASMRFSTVVAGTETVIFTLNDGITLLTGSKVKFLKRGFGTLNFASIAAGAYEDLTVSIVGATTTMGACVTVGLPSTGGSPGIIYTGFVSAADTVTIRAFNPTAAPIDPASAVYSALITGF